jgi:arylsulfatase A-like enzyme
MPTLADIAGVKAPAGLDGVSVLPAIEGKGRPSREFLYWEANMWDQKTQKIRSERLAQAVRMGDWKGVRTKPGAALELYNLKSDPGEKTNVAARNPQVVAKIEKYMNAAHKEPRPHPGSMQWVE